MTIIPKSCLKNRLIMQRKFSCNTNVQIMFEHYLPSSVTLTDVFRHDLPEVVESCDMYLRNKDYSIQNIYYNCYNSAQSDDYIDIMCSTMRKEEEDMHEKCSNITTKIDQQQWTLVVDWLIWVYDFFGYNEETLFLGISILNSYLSVSEPPYDDLQLLALTSLRLAAKFEEFISPGLEYILPICGNNYTKEDVISKEDLILEAIGFDISRPNVVSFVTAFLSQVPACQSFIDYTCLSLYSCLYSEALMKRKHSHIALASILFGKVASNSQLNIIFLPRSIPNTDYGEIGYIFREIVAIVAEVVDDMDNSVYNKFYETLSYSPLDMKAIKEKVENLSDDGVISLFFE